MVADTILTLASHNRSLVAGKIMARLRRAIDSTCDAPTQTLTEHDLYGEIIVLLRLVLNLSFHDHLNIEQFLPEVRLVTFFFFFFFFGATTARLSPVFPFLFACQK